MLRRVYAGQENDGFMNPDWLHRPLSPNGDFVFGVALIFATLAAVYAGKMPARFGGWIYRAEEPKTFWFCVAVTFLLGAYFVWLFWISPLPVIPG